jgi:threonine aldolase
MNFGALLFHEDREKPQMIELRSDTFTMPTPEMLAAIVRAPLGNDGYREDPTVRELEELAAARMGKEAACLMPSGTMANLASMMAHCICDKNVVLLGDKSDIHIYESGGADLCPGIVFSALDTQADGTIRIGDLEREFQKWRDGSSSKIALLCLENPHNLCGGVVLPRGYVRAVADFVHSRGVKLYLDGARIFNAAIASKTDVAEIVKDVDSLQFCLSKGLAAPVGSVVVGESQFVGRVRKSRKILGGNMRQAGIIAAAGIVALQRMVDRLEEDHINACRLAEGISAMPGVQVDLSTVQTNTVVFRVVDERFSCESFIASARRYGLNLSEFRYGRIRAVVHHGTDAEQIQEALRITAQVLEEGPVEEASYCAESHA